VRGEGGGIWRGDCWGVVGRKQERRWSDISRVAVDEETGAKCGCVGGALGRQGGGGGGVNRNAG